MLNLPTASALRVMILGVNGQVGWQLQQQGLNLKTLGRFPVEMIPIARQGTPLTLDLTDPWAIQMLIQTYQPQILINGAAYTAVDRAESEPELAIKINGTAPGILAEELDKIGGLLIHYSTDYVFDGQSTTPYLETDQTNPINVYGQSKRIGEQAIQASTNNYLILRTSWVYDSRGKNFLLTMGQLAQTQPQLKVVKDQIGSPTSAPLIARITYQILGQLLNTPDWQTLTGLYHLTAQGFTSWYGFAEKIVAHLAESSSHPLAALIPIPTRDYPTAAQRPAFSRLNCQKLQKTFGITLPAWEREFGIVWQTWLQSRPT
ncbi:dTDP-4-dehydrorhamnose reductase [Thermosynechococcaceae cyanobacterium BACA0444]|uniref:dTDP-4-dehydrorhamnose reductase n=1 Tax=Pseudocalidococcus azoricus BACA0444 TaxID=2918990 RepID=A0AAE4FPM8_9CYAN|nr:dTDP-4-dehydrorhamnose reductase [Pseudocalidococcus azoricus]MDS3859801.1 dTDP-4-dehydrorhamnose reductase [Pseudocalidococcus azoricus BACA0444]